MLYMPGDHRVCNPLEWFMCAFETQERYILENEEEHCNCTPACEIDSYASTMSSSPIANHVLNALSSTSLNGINKTAEYYKANIVKLDIFMEEISYIKIEEQKAYPILALLCDVGGALGLILGSTLLTVFEVLDFVIVSCMRRAEMQQRERRRVS